MSLLGLYITKTEAIRQGFNFEGTHFGVPCWFGVDERSGEVEVATKFAPFEIFLALGVVVIQFLNAMRRPGDEYEFSFSVRPIVKFSFKPAPAQEE